MKTIPEQYEKNGYTFRLLKRIGMFAMYEQAAGRRTWFEVVRIRRRGARWLGNGNRIVAGEYLPSDQEWGRHGWTYETRVEAEAALERRWNQHAPRTVAN